MQLFVPLGVGREQAPRSSGSGLAKIVAGTASPRLLVTGLHIIELPRNLRNGHLGQGDLSIRHAFGEDLAIRLSGNVKRRCSCLLFRFSNPTLLCVPTDVHRLQAPVRTTFTGANWFAIHFHENGVRVTTGEDAHRDPTGMFRFVIERHIVDCSIGEYVLLFDGLAVND